jgi:ubiquinone/menaquinone biosynthesis C-methylase UbiE
VNYDSLAAGYDRRYDSTDYAGVQHCLRAFLGDTVRYVAEVGCGTGHWLADVSRRALGHPFGLDLSFGMLDRARAAAPGAMLVRGTAGQLPWPDACLDRVFCINAIHHFPHPTAFISECRRVLRPGGGILIIGLDPHREDEYWWVYDFFPSALPADQARYPSTSTIRSWLSEAGFGRLTTNVAQQFPAEISYEAARNHGLLDRGATSQFMVITDDDFDEGIRRLNAEQPTLRAHLRLHATIGWA